MREKKREGGKEEGREKEGSEQCCFSLMLGLVV